MLAVKNNIMAANAARHLGRSYNALAKSVERLSSGLRINSAKDDAAGLAVRELIRADIAQFRQGSRNAQDGISMLQTAEGAMQVIDELLIRMKELAEQAATGSYSDAQRTIMNAEYGQLGSEITRIAGDTSFNSTTLLSGSLTYAIHIGSDTTIDVSASAMDAATLGVSTTGVQEAWTANRGRTTSYENYLDAADITDTTDDMFSFKFGATGTQVDVDLGTYANDGISLSHLVDEINSQWQTTIDATEVVASAFFDTAVNQWKLKMTNPDAETAAFTVIDSNSIDVLDNVDDFTSIATGASGTTVSLGTAEGATTALGLVTTAINTKDTFRAELGYMMNRLEAAVNVLDIQAESLLAAESRISDVDIATEMAAMTRNQVLAQAGVSMLAQANAMPQMALKLLG